MRVFPISFALVCGLAACTPTAQNGGAGSGGGGSGGGGASRTNLEVSIFGNFTKTWTPVAGHPDGGYYTFFVNGTQVPDTDYDDYRQPSIPGFWTFSDIDDGAGTLIVQYGESASEQSYAAVGVDPRTGETYIGAFYGRAAVPSSLPSGASATYMGEYASVLKQGGDLLYFISGDAMLVATLGGAAPTIEGVIDNRVLRTTATGAPAGFVAEALTLKPSAIDSDRAFSGAISGGKIAAYYLETSGKWEGFLAAPNGSEAVGVVRVSHPTAADTLKEVGAFKTVQP